MTLADVIVEDNFAGGGGGIANFGGSLLIAGSSVRKNSSAGITANGGGISNFAILSIDSSTISGNTIPAPGGSAQGGGIINLDTMTITNSTISGNSAAGNFGGGIYQTPGAISMRLENVTVAFNETVLSGGGLASVGGVVEMINTILSDNTVTGGSTGRDCSGTITSLGHNLIANTSACIITGVTSGNVLGRSAKLRSLANNGGPTETHSLRNSSRAIDAGNNALCPSQDQRGAPRTTTCDIGAFELR